MTEKAQLEKYGYKVITANTGEKAIDTFKDGHAIDLILMDINLGSGIDGTEAAQLILQDRDVPVVFVSSHTEPEVVEKTEKITSYGYVVKSSSITVLDASIKMAFKLFDANKKIRESEHQYRALVDGMPGIVYTFSNNRGGLFYSSSTKEILGYTPEQLLADPLLWQNSIHPDDFPHVVDAIATSEKGLPFQTSYRIKDAQGAWHWFEDRSFGARENGDELIIDGLALDITSLRQAEEVIRTKDIRLRKLFENIPDLVFQFTRWPDGSYCVPIASQGIKNIFGCSPEEVLEDFGPIGRVIHPEDAARVIADIEYSAEHLSYFTCEFRVILPGKGVQWIYSRSSPERLPDGSVTWHGFNANITEHRNAEQNYRELFLKMLEGFAIHEIICNANGDPIDYRFLAANPAFERMTGLKAEKIVGRTVLELLPGTEKTWIEIYGKVALTGEPAFFENYAIDLGKHFAVSAFRSAPNQFSCIFIDISDRKLREDEAMKAKVLLQASIESQRDLVIMAIDRDYRYLCFNSAHSEAMKTAYGKEVALGMNILDCITSQEDRFNAKANYDRALRGESHVTLQEYGDLEKAFFESQYSPILNDDAEIIGLTAFARDITERKQAEIALQETEQRYRELFDQMNEGLIVMTMDGRLFEVNPAFAEMHGYTVDELKSVDIEELDTLSKRTLEDRSDIRGRIEAGEIVRFEAEHYHKDGHIFRLRVTASMIKIGGEPFYLAFHQDITE
ncbi:MAG: PAS domain S-box protein [Rectinemataceae bacterium]